MPRNEQYLSCLFIAAITICLPSVQASVQIALTNGFYSIHSAFTGTCEVGAGQPRLSVTSANFSCQGRDPGSMAQSVNDAGGVEHDFGNQTKQFKFEEPELRVYNIRCTDGSESRCKSVIIAQVIVATVDENNLSCNITFADDKLTPFWFPSKVEWLRNDELVDGAAKELATTDFKDGDGNVKFFSFPLAQDDGVVAGRYECRFYQSSLTGDDLGPLSDVVVKGGPPVAVEMKVAPHKEQYIDGDAVNITCKFAGYPTPDISWYHNDKVIEKLGNITFYTEGGLASSLLSINPVDDSEHKGTYRCEGNNTLGGLWVEVVLHVRDRLAPLWPFLGIVVQVIALAICIAVGERCRKATLAKKRANMLRGDSTRT